MPTDTLDIEQRALALPEQARGLVVCDDATYQHAGGLLFQIKIIRQELDATFDPLIAKAHATHKEAVHQKKRHEEPLVLAEAVVKSRMVVYHAQQERWRLEEQRKLQTDAQLQEALDADARGDILAAEQALNGHGIVAIPPVPATPPVEGVSYRDTYSADVTDLLALVKAVASGAAPITVLQPNLPALHQAARALKEGLQYPGVRVVKTRTIVAQVGV